MIKKFILLVFALLLSFSIFSQDKSQSNTDKTIKIGAFNIQQFGNTKLKYPNVMQVLADIATNFDILAIEEVGSNKSASSNKTCEKIIKTYVELINSISKNGDYAYRRGNQYAIIYKQSVVEQISADVLQNTIKYSPLTAYIKTKEGNLDFIMIVVHTSPDYAKEEILQLKDIISKVSEHYNEPDVVCLGDYNADGHYFTEGTGTDLEGFEPEKYITVITNDYDTMATSDYTYDRIELSTSMRSDFSGQSGVIKVGDIYDVTILEGSPTKAGKEEAVSDHYPVWAEFYIDRDTD